MQSYQMHKKPTAKKCIRNANAKNCEAKTRKKLNVSNLSNRVLLGYLFSFCAFQAPLKPFRRLFDSSASCKPSISLLSF